MQLCCIYREESIGTVYTYGAWIVLTVAESWSKIVLNERWWGLMKDGIVVVNVNGVRWFLRTVATTGPVVHPRDDCWVCFVCRGCNNRWHLPSLDGTFNVQANSRFAAKHHQLTGSLPSCIQVCIFKNPSVTVTWIVGLGTMDHLLATSFIECNSSGLLFMGVH